jgi:Protein of unknown function (DUF3431)
MRSSQFFSVLVFVGSLCGVFWILAGRRKRPPQNSRRLNVQTQEGIVTLPSPPAPEIQIVIARYQEDLQWLKEDRFHTFYDSLFVYNKAENSDYFNSGEFREITLDNLGCEFNTYYQHIVMNYDNLADITVFILGSSHRVNKKKRVDILLDMVKQQIGTEQKKSVFSCGFIYDSSLHDNSFTIKEYTFQTEENTDNGHSQKLLLSKIRPLGAWLKEVIGVDKASECMVWNGIFAGAKKDILKRPKKYYETILYHLEVPPNSEVIHFVERSTCSVFESDDSLYFEDPSSIYV